MPTMLPRIHVSFQKPIYEALEQISEVEHTSLSDVVVKLVSVALELSEDVYLAEMAERRLKNLKRDDLLTYEEMSRWIQARKTRRK